MSVRSVAILGGPDTGKSTWIGAMLDLMDRDGGALEFDGMNADGRAYRAFKEPLEVGSYVQRTSKQADRELLKLDIPLRTRPPLSPERFSLHLADYAGEEVEGIFEHREWSDAWQDRALASALLLVHRPKATVALPRLPAVAFDPAQLAPGALFGELQEPATPEPPPADAPVQVPTALALVELLQCLRHARDLMLGERPAPGSFRVGVVFTAWDAVGPEWRAAGPEAYLQQELPLVADLLWSSFHRQDVRCFGLSATGGDLWNPTWKKRYLDDLTAWVEWPGPFGLQRDEDITLPLVWAIHGEAAFRGR